MTKLWWQNLIRPKGIFQRKKLVVHDLPCGCVLMLPPNEKRIKCPRHPNGGLV